MRVLATLVVGIALAVGAYYLATSTAPSAAPAKTTIVFKTGMDIQGEIDKLGEGAKPVIVVPNGDDVTKRATEALMAVPEGGVVEFEEGKYEFTSQLQLRVPNVIVRGKGLEKTILNFEKQLSGTGGEGMLVKANDFTIEDLTIEETKGDAIKVSESERVIFRRMATIWKNEGNEKNGPYGIYPVTCKNVLIEYCVAEGSSDAGVYVGQSSNIIVRYCRASKNVAGIEIENSYDADVYENDVTNNTGGLLVFDLPGTPHGNGGRHRVYKNKIHANNHYNFAPKGNIVSTVPQGTGLIIMATDDVEVFDNDIHDNQSANISIVSFSFTGRPVKEGPKEYDMVPEGIYIHDNRIKNGGYEPAGDLVPVAAMIGKPLPDIFYDGSIDPKAQVEGQTPKEKRVYIENNGEATFANLRFDLIGNSPEKLLTDPASVADHLPKIERNFDSVKGQLAKREPIKLVGIEVQ